MPLILFGHQYAGKSLTGKYLAHRFNTTWIDTDHLLCAHYRAITNIALSCREIYIKHGSEYFRELEAQVILNMRYDQRCVISLGGGCLENPHMLNHLKIRGLMLWIRCPKPILKQRALNDLPPFYSLEDFDASFEARFEKREALFKSIKASYVYL